MYFLLIQAQIFILFFIVYLIIYFCSLYELQISDQIFILVLTVAFMTIPHNLTPRLLKINGTTG
jgi:hypothetical protein